MANAPNYKFKYNSPVEFRLLFDDPYEGENDYGKWYRYQVELVSTGEEVSFFANPDLNDRLKDYSKGDIITVKKQEGEDNKTFWKVFDNGKPNSGRDNSGDSNKTESKGFPNYASLWFDGFLKLYRQFRVTGIDIETADLVSAASTIFIAADKKGYTYGAKLASVDQLKALYAAVGDEAKVKKIVESLGATRSKQLFGYEVSGLLDRINTNEPQPKPEPDEPQVPEDDDLPF